VITYLDASVVLRRLLNQPGPALEFGPEDETISSALTAVECFRSLDRLRLLRTIDEETYMRTRERVYETFDSCDMLDPGQAILQFASMSFPVSLKTLDSVHLATALVYRETTGHLVRMATHDQALARACRAMGLEVVGTA
jgi:hypothetical protein